MKKVGISAGFFHHLPSFSDSPMRQKMGLKQILGEGFPRLNFCFDGQGYSLPTTRTPGHFFRARSCRKWHSR